MPRNCQILLLFQNKKNSPQCPLKQQPRTQSENHSLISSQFVTPTSMSVAATDYKPLIEIDFTVTPEHVSNVQELSDSSISPRYNEFTLMTTL